MYTIIILISLAAFVFLIIGLIKPSKVLIWHKKPTRGGVFLYWVALTIFLAIVGAVFAPGTNSIDSKLSDEAIIDSSKQLIENNEFLDAKSMLKSIDTASKYYSQAKNLFREIDSIETKREKEKEIERKREKLQEQKENVKSIIAKIDNGIDFSKYRSSIPYLSSEIDLFREWASIIKKGQRTEDKEINRLANKLEAKVKLVQAREFPKLRKKYGKFSDDKLWEHDIDFQVYGSGYKYINITGGLFAANKNIKDMQESLSKVLHRFRFRQINYRWYDNADEYTYYKLYEGSDRDLVYK